MYELFLTCPTGLEEVCKAELQSSNISDISYQTGGVFFKGSISDIYKTNLLSRVGMNLLVKVTSFKFKNLQDYYNNIYKYEWQYLLEPIMTIAIDSKIDKESEVFNNSQFATLKAKDAIVDKIRKISRKRPSISKENPDIELKIFIKDGMCDIYLNSSGDSLYIRGNKKRDHKASINEALASGLIYLSKWDKKNTLIDPMCGSGTICSEAALIKADIAPGLNRVFAFQKWLNYDYDLFSSIKRKLISKINLSQKFNIYGSDYDYQSIDNCKQYLLDSKYNMSINYSIRNINNFDTERFKDSKNIIITNPPYGVRIDSNDSFKSIHAGFNKILKTNTNLYVIYPLEDPFIEQNYDYDLITELYNGALKCGFYNIKNG